MSMNAPIQTRRLLLRPLVVTDTDAYYELERDAEVNQFVGGVTEKSREDVEFQIANSSGGEYEPLAIIDRNTNQLIGRCGFVKNDNLGEVEIHIVLAKHVWKKGFGTEVGEALLSFGFDSLGLKKIIGVVDPQNHQSIRILTKLGMRHVSDISGADYTNGFHVYSIEQPNSWP